MENNELTNLPEENSDRKNNDAKVNKNRKKLRFIAFGVTFFLAGYCTSFFHFSSFFGAVPAESIAKMSRIESVIDTYYYKDYDRNALYHMAEEAMVYGLEDKYSYYLNEEESDSFDENITGNYVGIGVTLTPGENGEIVILAPFDGSPAKEAGIIAGDVLYKINETEYMYENIDEAVKIMRGKPGEKVTLGIIRNGKETLSVEVIKRKIEISSVTSKLLDDGTVYVRISRFDVTTDEDLEAELKKYSLTENTGLILDLRDNPGGVVDSALNIADMFIEDGIISTEKFKNAEDIVNKADEEALKISYPIGLLINGSSASASEIVTGALRDHKKAVIFGEKSYGKGVLNQKFTVSSDSAVVLSIGEYTTPNGESIHEKGIPPDFEVKTPDELKYTAVSDLEYSEDIQLQRVHKYLNGEVTE